MIYGDPRKGWGICPQMVEQPWWSAVREPPRVCQPDRGQQGSGMTSRGQVRAESIPTQALCRPLPQSVRSGTVLGLSFCTVSALAVLCRSHQLCCSPVHRWAAGVCVCAWALGEAGSWINEGAGCWDSHEGAGAGERAFPELCAWPEAKHRGGRLYVVDAEPCRCLHTGVGVQDTHKQGVIGLVGLGFPPRFEQMAQGPVEEERTMSSCPGPLGGLSTLPTGLPACPEVLQLSFLTV